VGVSKSWALRLGLCAAVLYLAGQAMGGRQGLFSLMALKERERAVSQTLATLRAENAALEARVLALSSSVPDRAALAEQTRWALGVGLAEGQLAALNCGLRGAAPRAQSQSW
jgi:cell division protein FtsB